MNMIKAKTIVLASGGKQKFTQKVTTEILKYKTHSEFLHSDYVLQEEGYNNLISTLNLKPKKKVVIIGGSHSGFSCAWLLINKPANYKEIMTNNISDYKPKYNIFCNNNCRDNGCCFGKVNDRNWNKIKNLDINDKIEVTILYKSHIKVYYSNEKEALNDGYNVYNPKDAVNKNGNVYPFVGIRGDAKELYRNIVKNKEPRVKLIKTKDFNEQLKYIKEASVVIWACGYTTNGINFFNYRNAKVDFLEDGEGGPCEVNKELRVLDSLRHPIKGLYGIGQGYSTFSIEIVNEKKGRADSINLYNTYIAKKLYKSLEPIFEKKSELTFNPPEQIKTIIPANKPVEKKNDTIFLGMTQAKVTSTPKRVIERNENEKNNSIALANPITNSVLNRDSSKKLILSSNTNTESVPVKLSSQNSISKEIPIAQTNVLSSSRGYNKQIINYNPPQPKDQVSSPLPINNKLSGPIYESKLKESISTLTSKNTSIPISINAMNKAPVSYERYTGLVNSNNNDNYNKPNIFNMDSMKFNNFNNLNNISSNLNNLSSQKVEKIGYDYRLSCSLKEKPGYQMQISSNKLSSSVSGIKSNVLFPNNGGKISFGNANNSNKPELFSPPQKSNILVNSIDNYFLKSYKGDNKVKDYSLTPNKNKI